MASTKEYIDYVCEQIYGVGDILSKKMFGEYLIYVNAKPILLVCDNIVYVKMLGEIKEEMQDSEIGEPYKGAKPHYILDIEDSDFSKNIVKKLELVIPIPKPRKKKTKD